jgi:transcriptional regulator with XRE-family HTH domain
MRPNPMQSHELVGAVLTKGHSVVRAWRELLGFAQTQLAKLMDVTYAAFARFERSGAKPREASRERVAKAMRLSSDLLDWCSSLYEFDARTTDNKT